MKGEVVLFSLLFFAHSCRHEARQSCNNSGDTVLVTNYELIETNHCAGINWIRYHFDGVNILIPTSWKYKSNDSVLFEAYPDSMDHSVMFFFTEKELPSTGSHLEDNLGHNYFFNDEKWQGLEKNRRARIQFYEKFSILFVEYKYHEREDFKEYHRVTIHDNVQFDFGFRFPQNSKNAIQHALIFDCICEYSDFNGDSILSVQQVPQKLLVIPE